jgi:hypothetical protein
MSLFLGLNEDVTPPDGQPKIKVIATAHADAPPLTHILSLLQAEAPHSVERGIAIH